MTNDPESYRAYDLIGEHFPPVDDDVNELVVIRSTTVARRRPGVPREGRGAGRGDRGHRRRHGARPNVYVDERPHAGRPERPHDGHPDQPRRRRRGSRGGGARGRRRRRGRRLRDRHDRRVHRRPRLLDARGGGSAEGRAPVRPPCCADRASPRLRRGRRGSAPRRRRARLDRRRARAHGAPRAGVRPLRLRREHDLRDGPGPRDRLLAVRRLAVQGGAATRGREARRDLDGRLDGEPRGALQRHRIRARDGRDGARSGHDPAQPRGRGDPRRDRHRRRRAHAPARGPRAARRSGERRARAVARPADRGERRNGRSRLVACRALRHACAGRGGSALRRRAPRGGRSRASDRDGPHRRARPTGSLRRETGVRPARRGVRRRDRGHGRDRGAR